MQSSELGDKRAAPVATAAAKAAVRFRAGGQKASGRQDAAAGTRASGLVGLLGAGENRGQLRRIG